MKIKLHRDSTVPALKNRATFIRLLQEALPAAGFNPQESGVLQIILLSPEKMAELNALHLGHQGVTDVITYDLRQGTMTLPEEEEEQVVAEIYLCPKVAQQNAELYQLSPSRELFLYAVHGMLHLQGEKDASDKEKKAMRKEEKRIMEKFEEKLQKADFL